MSRHVTTADEGHLPDVSRINFRFSGDGRYAACLARRGRGLLVPEVWDVAGARPRTLRTRTGETSASVPTPTDSGDVLLCRAGTDAHRLTLLTAPSRDNGDDGDDGNAEEHELAVFRGGVVRVVAGAAPGIAALVLATGADGRTSVWRLSGRAERPERIATAPYPVRGGIWLDETGRRLALTRAGAEPATVVLDTSTGALTPPAGPAADEYVLLAAPGAGVLLTAVRRDGAYRLGVRDRDDDGPARHPERLNAFDGEVTPLALNPSGRRLALAVNRRTRSHLVLHDLAADAGTEARLPAGVIHPAARWNTGGLHLVHSAPGRPAGLVGIAGCSVSRPPAAIADGGIRPSPARVLSCPGAAGPMEAIVYGDPTAGHRVVVALHGGPEAAWRFAHEPLFQRLSRAGIAVVAPNQRGSTGYGAAHRDAIRDAWGGPDLADVLALGRALAAARDPGAPRPMVYGASYGAYLALLACAAQADLWSRAAVVAPFLSGRALYEDGPPPVRALLDRLGGRTDLDDELGPRDLLRLAGRMRLPLLIVHGDDDPIIPVGHSRRLYARLRAARWPEGAAPIYLEVPGGGHDLQHDVRDTAVLDRVVDFLRAGPGA
ncbi:alpha/beta hydrolase family protein [Nonomuraea sp. NPDC001831]|uniref:alpha/beta hydrolase family protein n=1 Tax=Nonomuraea sp. NPDC001831 TaxID=3364340 RepID=UPI0036BD0FEF